MAKVRKPKGIKWTAKGNKYATAFLDAWDGSRDFASIGIWKDDDWVGASDMTTPRQCRELAKFLIFSARYMESKK